MIETATNSNPPKSAGQILLEYVLLGICLCVIVLRATFAEGPGVQAVTQPLNISDDAYSLSMSAALVVAAAGWLLWSLCRKRFVYRFTRLEGGLCLFIIAAVIGVFVASNKRAAITNSVTLTAPILMSLLLVQLLDSKSRIKLTLAVIATLGVVSAYQCAEQFFLSNPLMIEQYRQAPQTILEPLGIEPGTFAHMLFEHRLYSKGVHGFFTTSNSAGSFALLTFFAAIALFADEVKNYKQDPSGPARVAACGAGAAAVLFGLAITASKGAIVACAIAGIMFGAYLLFGNWVRNHRRIILACCALLFLAGSAAIIFYRLAHNRLPGGNSMLVRWQYWVSSARMYADHFLTGVGPGNFVHYYPRYKIPSALETVADPHNVLLSILTQYGPLGLVGLLGMILAVLWKVIFGASVTALSTAQSPEQSLRIPALSVLTAVVLAFLVIRPTLIKIPPGTSSDQTTAAVIILYLVPAVVFVAGFLLMTFGRTAASPGAKIITAAVFCAIIGLLIHNLIDFAIFEPGVLTAFWAMTACLIALDRHDRPVEPSVTRLRPLAKAALAAGTFALILGCFNFALVPVAKSTDKIKQAREARAYGGLDQAQFFLSEAANDDRLSPAAPYLSGLLYVQQFEMTGKKTRQLLESAQKSLLDAAERNKVDFKSFERLSEVYSLFAETAAPAQKAEYLNKAFESAAAAVERYPGSCRLRVELAEIAEQIGKIEPAIENYEKAVEIEDSYREQFRRMYPGRKVFSRLGEEKYETVKERIARLSKLSVP